MRNNSPGNGEGTGFCDQRKIIGGHEVEPHSRPYMAFLQVKKPGYTARCGGFLVREDFVLTAAHCQGCTITVTLGAHNIKKKEGTQQVIKVKEAIPHPNYDPDTKANDIMLLQLEKEVKLTAAVSVLRLPNRRVMVKPGMVCRVVGWGRLDLSTSTNKLHEVELEIQKDELCISCYESPYNRTTQICVGDPEKNQSTFLGDSGGPLVCGKLAQGIVSYGKKNGKPPRVETRISSFLPWIKRTMRRFQLQRPD
ncbi:mast cell protease 1A-like [Saccopteryx bilineata]|uniref:mast cell protease 1A-like n=1 Tax=Saccopteryx bilineata TaxID=59482 RepID=UPI00338E58E5